MNYLFDNKENLKINLGTGKGYSILEAINLAEEVIGQKINYEISERKFGDPRELIASAEKAYVLLDWKAKYSDLKTIFKTMSNVYL